MNRQMPVLALLVVLSFSSVTTATVPTQMTVQGRLTDLVGVPLPAGSKTLGFRIFSDSTAGTQIWPTSSWEFQSITSANDGLWIAMVGALIPLTDSAFTGTDRWLEVAVDMTIMPRVRLETGPFAYRVSTVDGASGGTITSKLSIGPGHTNNGADAFVAGTDNQVTGNYSNVGGGTLNNATGESSVISGGQQSDATGFASTIGGGADNTASNSHSTVGGGLINSASGARSVIGGGYLNTTTNSEASIGGGRSNGANGDYSTIGGGLGNLTSDTGTVIAGGGNNRARGLYSTVGGGGGSSPADSNAAHGTHSTVGGGRANIASGDSSVIAGGSSNRATGQFAVIGGGVQNTVTGGGSTVAGGGGNSAGGGSAAVGGGAGNSAGNDYSVVAGGRFNRAIGYTSTVGGGDVNTASSHYATVPGGFENVASGSFSFAAGSRAHALHTGTFVWAGGSIQKPIFSSTGDFQFLINASGGVGINTNVPQQALSVVGGMNLDHLNENVGTVVNSLRFGSSSGEAIASKRDAGGNQYGLDFYTNSIIRMSITNASGSVGIGTTGPSERLHVMGNILASACVIGSNIACPSDARFKRNIETLPHALETVARLRGVRYEWRADEFEDREFAKGEQVGLIAQEVRELVPQAVIEQSDGYLAVDYARLVPLLIEGMKEQQRQIDDLRARLDRQAP